MLIGGVDFGRASVGTRHEVSRDQNVQVMGDGSVRTRNAAPAGEFLTYYFNRMTDAQWSSLSDRVRYVWDFSSTAIAIVDDYGTAFTVRYWKDSLKGECRLGRFWKTEITFRVES